MSLMQTLVNVAPPTAIADGSQAQARAWKYGETMGAPILDRCVLAAEGTYYKACNPTFGSALTMFDGSRQSPTSADSTHCMCVWKNTASAGGVTVYPDYMRIVQVGVGANGTNFHIGIQEENADRYSSGGTELITAGSYGNVLSSSSATPSSSIHFGNVTMVAAGGSSKNVGRAALKTQASPNFVAGDQFFLTFGGLRSQGSGAAAGSTANQIHVDFGPFALGPGGSHSLVFICWSASVTTSPTCEVEVGWFER